MAFNIVRFTSSSIMLIFPVHFLFYLHSYEFIWLWVKTCEFAMWTGAGTSTTTNYFDVHQGYIEGFDHPHISATHLCLHEDTFRCTYLLECCTFLVINTYCFLSVLIVLFLHANNGDCSKPDGLVRGSSDGHVDRWGFGWMLEIFAAESRRGRRVVKGQGCSASVVCIHMIFTRFIIIYI